SLFFFFQAEDGIRDFHVTGVQTCALPISTVFAGQALTSENSGDGWESATVTQPSLDRHDRHAGDDCDGVSDGRDLQPSQQGTLRSEERRVGKEGRSRGWRAQ